MPLLKKVKQEKKNRQSQVKCVASHWQVCSCHQYCEHNQSTYCEKRKLQWEFFPSVTHRNASRWQPTFYKKLDQKLCDTRSHAAANFTVCELRRGADFIMLHIARQLGERGWSKVQLCERLANVKQHT